MKVPVLVTFGALALAASILPGRLMQKESVVPRLSKPRGVEAPGREHGFLDRTVTVDGVAFKYQVYVPADNVVAAHGESIDHLPVILFLHGSGERGSDGLRQTAVGLPAAIRWDRSRWPFLVIMPQAREDDMWSGLMAKQALATLDAAVAEFDGDPERVILSGMSMGGNGALLLAAQEPDRFAALVDVCGFVTMPRPDLSGDHAALYREKNPLLKENDPVAAVAQRIASIPLWIFHGNADDVVLIDESKKLAATMQSLGANVTFTELEGVNHNAWDPAYGTPELVPWMLEKRRGRK